MLVEPVPIQSWDDKIFSLGDQIPVNQMPVNQMLVRMPNCAEYALKILKEQQWLPKLSPLLPFAIPKPIVMGKPDENFPYSWSIYNWIEGDSIAALPVFDAENIATSLAQFITALNNIDITDGPIAEPESFAYTYGLEFYNNEMRQTINILKDKVDVNIVKEIWKEALRTNWQKTPVLVHGDISAGNISIQQGRLHTVIDFGDLSISDPSCDLVIA